jgi:hypothetical protein
MSARRSPVEVAARELAGAALKGARRRRRDTTVTDVFLAAIRSREETTTWAVQRGDIPAARRQARAAELLSESLDRLLERQKRDVAAELARTGIAGGARVVVVRAGYSPNAAPVGTVLTLEATSSHYMFGNDDDGHRWIVYSGDLEVVPDVPADAAPMPHDDEWSRDATSAPPFAPGEPCQIADPEDRYFGGMLGVVREIWTHPETGKHYAAVSTDDGSFATWPTDGLEHVGASA